MIVTLLPGGHEDTKVHERDIFGHAMHWERTPVLSRQYLFFARMAAGATADLHKTIKIVRFFMSFASFKKSQALGGLFIISPWQRPPLKPPAAALTPHGRGPGLGASRRWRSRASASWPSRRSARTCDVQYKRVLEYLSRYGIR